MKRISYFLIPAILLFSTCSKKDNSIDDFSSQRSLFVDHISSHTAGFISVGSEIQLRLTKAMVDSLKQEDLDEVFDFSPEVHGTTSIRDNRTIVFDPSGKLEHNQKYEVIVNLKPLIPGIDKDKEEFKFIFQTLVQNYEVLVGGFKMYDRSNLERVKIEGSLQTADITDFESLKKILAASQEGESLEITFSPTNQSNSTAFVIENVQRKENASKVEIKLDGEAIQVDKGVEMVVNIPALDDYQIISSRVVQGDENLISVLFSDPLDPEQNLTGLINLSNTNNLHRTVIDLNELKIYPTQEISNTVTLTIEKSIKNLAGYQLQEPYEIDLQFTQSKPELRLVTQNDRSILPNSKGLVLPFEAVGLKAVDVTVIRIFEDNVLQYLQVNNLGGQYELRRVGKPTVRKTIPLNASGVTDLNSWNRFTLDLNDILTTEPGALYQIRLGFKKQHSLYFCAENQDLEALVDDDDWGTQEEDSYWDNYEYYYNPNFNWEERDNPCSDSYYGTRRSISKMLFASDLGIIAKQRDNGLLHVFVTHLLNTEPLDNVLLQVYDYQQQVIGDGITNKQGKAIIDVKQQPFALVAKKEGQTGYLKIDDGSSLSLSNFNVGGSRVQKGLKGFIFGERGVWRPADTVHVGFILEDKTESLPADHPVILELFNPNGQLTHRQISTEGVEGIYRFDVITTKDAPTGNWTATVKVGGATFGKRIRIETIKPNRLKLNLDLDKEKFSANDKIISGNLNVRWLTGAKANRLRAEYDALVTPVNTTFKGYPNYEFDDKSKDFQSDRITIFQGNLDQEGNTRVSFDLGDTKEAPGALQVNLYGKVYEEGGDFSIGNTSVLYFPYTGFVGIKAPEGDKRGMLLTDQDHDIQIASVDAEGNPISRSNLKVKLYKLNWRWWWDNSFDNISNYVGRSYTHPIDTRTVSTTNGKGTYSLRINYPEWGRYFIQVEDPVSGHSTGKIVYIDWPGWAGKGKRGELDGASMLDFTVDKEEYSVGDKINMTIPTTKGNRILVSLESGSEVLESFWVETDEETTRISIDAIPDMAPNVYAHLTMIQPHGQTSNDLPIRLYGVTSIKVVNPDTRLEPTIIMPKELRPEQVFEIKVGEKSGKSMAYTLAVVDEGLLDITNFDTPNPWSTFYAREALGVKTWDVYDDVMGAFSGKMDYLLAIGGDGEMNPKEETEANRFKPVVRFLGPYYLDKNDENVHKIKMPQYIGSVKTMVVAASQAAYGHISTTTPVKQPMMILATLPRVAGPGEIMKLPVNVFTMQDNIKSVSVQVEVSGNLSLTGTASKTIQFTRAGDKIIDFDIKAKEAVGIGKVKVTATSGSLKATYDVEMNVIPRNPPITRIQDKLLPNGESWQASYDPVGMLGENGAFFEFSTMPPLNIQQRLRYLIRYPHGCIEQTTSSVFAQLYLDKLTDLPDERHRMIQRNIEAGIKRIQSFQLGTGGFSYWPGTSYYNSWGTNYAGHFLLEARKHGYKVPESLLSNWISFQSQQADAWNTSSSDDNNDLVQAYRLYTLSLANHPSIGAMNRMKEMTNLSTTAKWRLALAYAEAGYRAQAIELIDGLNTTGNANQLYYRYTYGSALRDQAMVLETLLALDEREKGFEIVKDIASYMGDSRRWMSTQTTAYCFLSLAKYAELFGTEGKTNVEVNIGNQSFEIENQNYISQLAVPEPDKTASVSVKNSGETPIYIRLIRTGIPLEGGEEISERNIKLRVTYTDMNGNYLDVSQVKQGTNFKAKVTVENPGLRGYYSDLALTQIFPAGWEIVNTRLDGSQAELNKATYIDIRDDRVMHYFDLTANASTTFEVLLIAAYQGRYYLPSVKVEAMYDNSIFSNLRGNWVEVVE